jgi:hypothetical protein
MSVTFVIGIMEIFVTIRPLVIMKRLLVMMMSSTHHSSAFQMKRSTTTAARYQSTDCSTQRPSPAPLSS